MVMSRHHILMRWSQSRAKLSISVESESKFQSWERRHRPLLGWVLLQTGRQQLRGGFVSSTATGASSSLGL